MAIPDASGQIHAVYQSPPPNHGTPLQIIDPATGSPGGGEVEVSWNVTGPQGPEGAQGPAGPTGPAGPQGIQGPIGPQGPDGESAALTVAPVAAGMNGLPAGGLSITDQSGNTGYVGSGIQGPAGPTGPAGPPGASPTLSVITVTAVTAGFAGSPLSVVAQAPDGYVVTGGGFSKGQEDQDVTDSRPTDDGTGWYVAFNAGPSGYQVTAYARCLQVS